MTENIEKNLDKTSASPKARKFARELGVDINEVSGSERIGRVIEKDIKHFISSKINKSNKYENKIKNKSVKMEYKHSEFGEIEIKDIPRVKKIAAPHLSNSWTNIPHVTNHDEADITELEEFRSSLTDSFTGERKKITPLAFIIKAKGVTFFLSPVKLSVREFLNSSNSVISASS